VEVVASLSQGRTAAAQCGLFTYKSVPVIFEPPCMSIGTEVSIDLSENFTLFAPCLYCWHVNKLYHTCTYNRLPEDGSSGS